MRTTAGYEIIYLSNKSSQLRSLSLHFSGKEEMRGHYKATFVRLFITFPRDNFLPPPPQTLRRLPMAKKVVNGCLGDEELLRTVNTVKKFLILSVLTVY